MCAFKEQGRVHQRAKDDSVVNDEQYNKCLERHRVYGEHQVHIANRWDKNDIVAQKMDSALFDKL